MGVHHLAFATKDAAANHRFYTEAMGFELVKVEVAQMGKGWAKHLFYTTGSARDQMIAFWDLHDPSLGELSADISRGQGLPPGVNHLAFSADGLDDLARRKERWLAHGHDVMEIDHDWCVSVYTTDPNGIMVEFCTLTRELNAADRAEAEALLKDPAPSLRRDPKSVQFVKAKDWAAKRSAA